VSKSPGPNPSAGTALSGISQPPRLWNQLSHQNFGRISVLNLFKRALQTYFLKQAFWANTPDYYRAQSSFGSSTKLSSRFTKTVFGVIRYVKYIHILSFTITLAFIALHFFATFQIVTEFLLLRFAKSKFLQEDLRQDAMDGANSARRERVVLLKNNLQFTAWNGICTAFALMFPTLSIRVVNLMIVM